MLEILETLNLPSNINWQDALDILIITLLTYNALIMIKGTRALAILIGFGLLLLLYIVSIYLELYSVMWLLEHIVGSLFLVLVIVFQKDIRQGLGEMGARYFWRRNRLDETMVEEIVNTCVELARLRLGVLIIIERAVPLGDMIRQEGVTLNATISKKLLHTIFLPPAPLHDGAVIISKGKVAAASCILPLAVVQGRNFGTRHRAAIGITEETDALAIVVSEERGEISIALKGVLTPMVTAAKLKEVIDNVL